MENEAFERDLYQLEVLCHELAKVAFESNEISAKVAAALASAHHHIAIANKQFESTFSAAA
ncbi:MAG TPA: hypothetical protein VN653_10925 [Anaerolineales bacterium]|nr:hypothetical protein [Anaerolineales bacterium]